jgi:Icc protein
MSLPTPDRPVTLLHLTDMHLYAHAGGTLLGVDTAASFQAVLRHVIDSGRCIDRILATGDLSQDGSHASYVRFLSMTAALGTPLHALPGNHDVRAPFHEVLAAQAAPVVDCGAWRIVLLDSLVPGTDGGHLAEDQLDLLRDAGQIGPDRHLLVALHHNPIPMDSAWLDPMQVDNAPMLFDILAGLPRARALVWGHVHQAHDSRLPATAQPAGLHLMSTPSTCFQFLPRSTRFSLDTAPPGYRWIMLHPDGRIETEVVRIPALPPEAGHPQLNSSGY